MADYWDSNVPSSQLNPVESAEQHRILTGGLTPEEERQRAQEQRFRELGIYSNDNHGRSRPVASFKDNLRAVGLIMLLVFVVYGNSGSRSRITTTDGDEASSTANASNESAVGSTEPVPTSSPTPTPTVSRTSFKPSRAAYAFLYSLGWFALAALSVHSNDPHKEDWQTILKKSALAPLGILVLLAVVTFLVTFLSMFLGRLVLNWKDGFDPGIVFQSLLVFFVIVAGLLVAGPFIVSAINGYRPQTRWKFTLPAMGSIGLLMVFAVALFGTVRGLIWS